MEKKVEVKSGCGLWSLGFLLTVLFVILKLVGVITWGWLAVFAPVLIAIGIYLVVYVLIFGFIIGVLGIMFAAMRE